MGVPYFAARGDLNLLVQEGADIFPSNHEDIFIQVSTNVDGTYSVVPGSLRLTPSGENDYVELIWTIVDHNNVPCVDNIHMINSFVMSDILSVSVLPICVIAVGDLPYQCFNLGMENMSESHCPYCKLSATNFGDVDNHMCELRTHAG